MEKPVLCDPSIYPTGEVIASHLGRAKSSFVSMFLYNHIGFPDFVETWRYYNDGKSWLLNVSRKKKTVFWLSVSHGCFRTSFYLNARAEHSVLESGLPDEYKKQFMESAGKKFRAISIVIRTKKDIATYKELLSLKMSSL